MFLHSRIVNKYFCEGISMSTHIVVCLLSSVIHMQEQLMNVELSL